MGSIITFPLFDIFSYLIVGLLLIAACDLIYGTQTFFHKDWGLSATTTIIIAAYVIGHIVSFASGNLLEEPIAGGVMKRPTVHLLRKAESAPTGMQKMVTEGAYGLAGLLSGYFEPLGPNTQAKIAAKLKDKKLDLKCEDRQTCTELYWEAYNTVKQNKEAFERFLVFHERANFTRNLSFASFLAAICVLVLMWRRGLRNALTPSIEIYGLPRWLKVPAWQLTLFVFVGLVMFSRYLYFTRAETIEILTSFAYLGDPVTPAGSAPPLPR